MEPDHAPVRRDHAVLERVGTACAGRCHAVGDDSLTIRRVKVRDPEVGLGRPLRDRIAEQALRLVTDEREAQGLGIRFPDDAVDRVDQLGAFAVGRA